jgi:hypothetical protein
MGEDIDIRYICHLPSNHHFSYDLISSSVFVHTQIPVLPYSAILYLVERRMIYRRQSRNLAAFKKKKPAKGVCGNCASVEGPLPSFLYYLRAWEGPETGLIQSVYKLISKTVNPNDTGVLEH